MPTIVQFRRGTQAQNNNFQGAAGELSVNTTANALRIHDGSTPGGFELARADMSNVTNGVLPSLSIGTGIGNTEVISSSRQLKNITTIDAGTKGVFASSLLNDSSLNIVTGNINAGIVTATTRLNVGTGLTVYPAGNAGTNVNITGILTATHYGSGVNLSGVVTSIVAGSGIQITSNNTGIVTVTATGGGGSGGGLTAIQLQSNSIVVGSAGTFNFTNDFNVPIVGSGGIGTISISSTKALSLLGAIPATGGQGYIGTVGSSWGNGHFSTLIADNDLNITNRASIPNSSQLRFGTANNVLLSYNGGSNRFNIDLQNTVVDFAINNGSGGPTQFIFTRSSGRLGIGITSPAESLDVLGSIQASQTVSATDFNTTSDINLKNDIETITNALDLISSIRGVRFSWKENAKPSLGVIAQEVEQVFPELVTVGEKHKKVNYNGLIGVLVESVKDLRDEIGELRKQNENLQYQINLTSNVITEIINKLS